MVLDLVVVVVVVATADSTNPHDRMTKTTSGTKDPPNPWFFICACGLKKPHLRRAPVGFRLRTKTLNALLASSAMICIVIVI